MLGRDGDYVENLQDPPRDTPMATSPAKPADPAEPAAYLDMPSERRASAKAHAAMLSATMRKVAADTPFQADVDDFRRVLTAESRFGGAK